MNNFFAYDSFNIKILSKIFVLIVLLISSLVLIGWQFDINSLKTVLPFLAAMNPLTSVCFLLIVASFQLIIKESRLDQKYFISKIILSIILLICLTKLICLYYNVDFKIDAVLFNGKINSDSNNNRLSSSMSVFTTLGFIFLVVALWLFHYKTERRWVLYQFLAILVFYFCFFSLLCYSYKAPEFYDLIKHFQMTLLSAICFILISLSILLTRLDVGIVKEFSGSLAGSSIGKELLFSAFVIPFLLGFVRIYLSKANIFSNELSIALLVMTFIIIFCSIVLASVILLNKKDLLKKITEAKFQSLIESAPDAIVILNEKNIIQLINIQTEKMFGYDRIKIIDKPINLLIADLPLNLNNSDDYEFSSTKEYNAIKDGGEVFPVEIRISPLITGKETLTSISIRDISVRKLLEEINWNNQEIFKTLVTNVVDYAIFMLDVHGNILTWNKGAEFIKGYKRSEVQGKCISIFYLEGEAHIADEMLLEAKEKGKCEREGWRVRKNGSVFWADVIITALHDKNGIITGYAKVTRDFTDKKKMQDALANFNESLSIQVNEKTKEIEQTTEQLRQLSAHLQTAREEERKYIAREMHDELGQMITGLRMDVIWLKKKVHTTDDVVLLRFERTLELLNDVKQAMRRIAMDLHPAVLNDLGLITALKVHGKDFENRSGIKTIFDIDLHGVDDLQIDSNISIGLYRIFQESLNNVAKHAGAEEVNACLKLNAESLEFTISDNGKGFNLSEAIQKKSLGLISMRERMFMIDGEYNIQSSLGSGTTISLTVPLKFK